MGFQFTPMSLNMADAQFLENSEMTIKRIATAFGIKMHQLNDLSRATHTNIAEQQKDWYVDGLQPALTTYEQELSWKLFVDSELREGYYAKFNVDAILRADIKTRYEAYGIAIEKGFMTPNEARAKEEESPLPGGDQLIVNGNFIPLTMTGQQYLKGGDGTENEKGNQGDSSSSSNTGNQGDDGGE